jgi:large subunit ribosomal protein L1
LYEVAIRVHSLKPGTQPISGTIMLPHPIASKITTAVICPEGSEIAKQALEAGAVLVGEESMFAKIREGQTNFQRLLVHDSSEINFNRARLGPILGPKGLMPSRKRGTITANIKKELASQTRLFRERTGVIRLPIGYMAYTPKMVAENLKAIVDEVKNMAGRMGGQQNVKKIMEVVLSSSHGPGFSLNGRFLPSDRDVSDKDLAGPM